jgi:hypothetical protein
MRAEATATAATRTNIIGATIIGLCRTNPSRSSVTVALRVGAREELRYVVRRLEVETVVRRSDVVTMVVVSAAAESTMNH